MVQASLAIQVLPQTKDCSSQEVLRIVDSVIKHIAQSKCKYVVSPFETVLEGELSQLMQIAQECQEICIQEGADSVMAYLKIAYAPESGVFTIDEKLAKY